MPFISLKVRSPGEVVLPSFYAVLGEGVDVLTVTVASIDSFLSALRAEGVEVLKVHRLDELEAPPPDPEVQAALTGRIAPELVSLGVSSVADTQLELRIGENEYRRLP